MPRTKLEDMLSLQKNQIGILQKFITNFKKLGKIRFTRENLTARLEILEGYWSQVLRTQYVLCENESINDTDYMKEDLFSETESQYLATKIKINELLSKEIVTESAGNKTGYHNEVQGSKLPKVMIPEFNGNINKWEDFRNIHLSGP